MYFLEGLKVGFTVAAVEGCGDAVGNLAGDRLWCLDKIVCLTDTPMTISY